MDLSKGKNRKTFQIKESCAILTKKREKIKKNYPYIVKNIFIF